MIDAVTLLDALVSAVLRAGAYNKNDQAPPTVVLWTDKERQWEALLPQLRQRLPSLLTFDAAHFAPAQRRGPAYWLRCMIAGTLPDDRLPAETLPILYLPGVSKQEMRAVEECPKPLQPLAELQFRGVVWTQRNGRDWTIAAFLQSNDGGLGIEVAADQATRQALIRALPRLVQEPIEHLRKEAPLRAAFFDELLNPDEVRSLLLWLNDPSGYRQQVSDEAWASFCGVCKRKYQFDPEKDGPISAATLLGKKYGVWAPVWQRYFESARSYPNLPDLLQRARPAQLALFEPREPWPQENQSDEAILRERLTALRDRVPDEARATIEELEKEHGPRRAWVWAGLGHSPLATALQHLVTLARETERALGGTSVAEIATQYADRGWRADAAVIDALAAVQHADDVAAVKAAIVPLYRTWLEKSVSAFQKAAEAGYLWQSLPAPAPGTCILFSDALRFDVGQRLAEALRQNGLTSDVKWQLVALPSITSTAKAAVSPVADRFSGDRAAGLEPTYGSNSTRVIADVLRKALDEAGYQVLRGDDRGDPSGRAWSELGAIDSYGHEHGWKIAHHVEAELLAIQQRIEALLDWGWKQIVVVTDHGWLMLPGGLPKIELPNHLTVIRKGRCARLKDGSNTDQQVVPWHWDKSVRIAVATGIGCYEAGKEYEHGGLSPEECVTPIITVTRPLAPGANLITIDDVTWRGMRCRIKVSGARTGLTVDIRSKAGAAHTSLVDPRSPDAEGTVSLLVADDDRLGEAVFVVVLDETGALLSQTHTTVGG